MTRSYFFLACILLLHSCGSKTSYYPGILKPEKMQSVLWDVMRAESYSNHFISMGGNKNLPEENARFQKQIFSIHHITRAEFDKSFSYYNSRPDLMKVLLDSIIAKAGREKNNNPFLVPKTESVK